MSGETQELRHLVGQRLAGRPVWDLSVPVQAGWEVRARLLLGEPVTPELLRCAASQRFFRCEEVVVYAGISGQTLRPVVDQLDPTESKRISYAVRTLRQKLDQWDGPNHGKRSTEVKPVDSLNEVQVAHATRARDQLTAAIRSGGPLDASDMSCHSVNFDLLCEWVEFAEPRWLGDTWSQMYAVDAATTVLGPERGAEWLRWFAVKRGGVEFEQRFLWDGVWGSMQRLSAFRICAKELVATSWDPAQFIFRHTGPLRILPAERSPGQTRTLVASLRQLSAQLDQSGAELLAPGVPDSQIAAIEAEVGLGFPDDFKEFYRAQNGTRGHWGPLGFQTWISLDRAIATWRFFAERGLDMHSQTFRDAQGPMKPLFNYRGWFPFAGLGEGEGYLCVDLDPAHGGTIGQVIETPDDGGSRGRVLAPGIAAWLKGELSKAISGASAWEPKSRWFNCLDKPTEE